MEDAAIKWSGRREGVLCSNARRMVFGRRGVEACHMVGVKNKEDLFYVVAAREFYNGGFGTLGFIPEGNRDRPGGRLAAATSRWRCRSLSLVIVGDKLMI